jgi:hypothetical protein
MSEVANTQETEETTTAPAPVVEIPKIREWKAYDGRTTGRNPREKVNHQTNADYAATQEHFKKACEMAETPATARQASKFRMGKGIAYEAHRRHLKATKG